MGSASVEGRPSSLEGVEIIRAFLKIEHREVREAIIKLVTSLSSLKSGANDLSPSFLLMLKEFLLIGLRAILDLSDCYIDEIRKHRIFGFFSIHAGLGQLRFDSTQYAPTRRRSLG